MMILEGVTILICLSFPFLLIFCFEACYLLKNFRRIECMFIERTDEDDRREQILFRLENEDRVTKQVVID